MIRKLTRSLGLHPRAWIDAVLTYPRFLGRLKPCLLEAGEHETRLRLEAMHRVWEVQRLRVPVGRRILALSPHPDDESVGAGGLLAAHAGKASLHLVTFFDGVGGGAPDPGDPRNGESYQSRLKRQRREELEAVARRLGAESVTCLDVPDTHPAPTEENVRRVAEVVRRIDPDVVVLPWYLDGHWQHRMLNAVYAAGCAELSCVVLGYEVWSLLSPNAVFELGEHLQAKLELVRCYRSQLATIDFESYVRGMALVRAFQFEAGPLRNVPTEAFLALPNRDYCELVRRLYGVPGKLTAAAASVWKEPDTCPRKAS